MNIIVTSRHFKAQDSLVEYAREAVGRLTRFYDGVVRGEVILSYEKKRKSVKSAEIILSVYKTRLTAESTTMDFQRSVDVACDKLAAQLRKYKDRLHQRDRTTVRRVREKL
ncbi:MAG: ribosome-associated translation inhibitor RaiA [Ignavibacteriales bacterium]|nr:ribosome-associated translation inhibitor RaiA [Ignavibacteriales bacterium]